MDIKLQVLFAVFVLLILLFLYSRRSVRAQAEQKNVTGLSLSSDVST